MHTLKSGQIMRAVLMALSLITLGLAGPVLAQSAENPVVIELYTSQGCSSCPPADAVLTELASRKDVIALALHVDYWDYIGWKDTFGQKAFAERQRSYAKAAGEKMIYTPQMVINGQDRLVGQKRSQLESLLRGARGAGDPVLTVTRDGSRLRISATVSGKIPEGSLVQLVRYIPSATVAVKRGENAGRTIEYSNTVTSWEKIGTWNGAQPLGLEVKAKGDEPAVVIIQEPGPGRILAAVVSR
ncbi:MAG: DUF1223 domain-containing protein [Albidovulum sp.]